MAPNNHGPARVMLVVFAAIHCMAATTFAAAEKTVFVTKAAESGQKATDFDFLCLIPAATMLNGGTPAILAVKGAADLSRNQYLKNYLSRYKPDRAFTVNFTAKVPNTKSTASITAASGRALSDTIALRFWKAAEKIVVVKENRYDEALQGAALAAVLGVPLIYYSRNADVNAMAAKLGTKEVLYVGSSATGFSVKTTMLAGVVDIAEYLEAQGRSVDYFAATNPGDRSIKDGPKQSLIAPLLAALRSGIVVPLKNSDSLPAVKAELSAYYKSLNRYPKYLALVGSSAAIPHHYETDGIASPKKTGLFKLIATDFHYSDVDGDPFPDIAIGRVVTYDIFDGSIYASRVSTYNDLGDGNWEKEVAEAGVWKSNAMSHIYKNYGFRESRSYLSPDVNILPGSTAIEAAVVLHGFHSNFYFLGGFLATWSENILSPCVIISSGCSAAGVDLDPNSAGKTLMKLGATAFVGAPRNSVAQSNQARVTVSNRLIRGYTVGEAFKDGITELTLSTLIGKWDNRQRYNLMLVGDPALAINVPKAPIVKPASGVMKSDTLMISVPKTVYTEPLPQVLMKEWGWDGSRLHYPACPGTEPVTYWAGRYDKYEPCFMASVTDNRPILSIKQVGEFATPLGKKGDYFYDTLQNGSARALWLVRVIDFNHETGKVTKRIDSIRYAVAFDEPVTRIAANPDPAASADSRIVFSAGVLRYTLSHRCRVRLEYFDMRGRRIASPVNTIQGPGNHSLSLQGVFRAKGTYVQVFTAGDRVSHEVVVVSR